MIGAAIGATVVGLGVLAADESFDVGGSVAGTGFCVGTGTRMGVSLGSCVVGAITGESVTGDTLGSVVAVGDATGAGVIIGRKLGLGVTTRTGAAVDGGDDDGDDVVGRLDGLSVGFELGNSPVMIVVGTGVDGGRNDGCGVVGGGGGTATATGANVPSKSLLRNTSKALTKFDFRSDKPSTGPVPQGGS